MSYTSSCFIQFFIGMKCKNCEDGRAPEISILSKYCKEGITLFIFRPLSQITAPYERPGAAKAKILKIAA